MSKCWKSGSTKLSPDMMLTVWRLVEDKLLNIILRSELNECRSKEESKNELKVMLEIGLCGKFLCTELSLFLYFIAIALWMLTNANATLQQIQNNPNLSLPSGSDILPIY